MILVHAKREFGMRVAQERVREFMEFHHRVTADVPTTVDEALAHQRHDFIAEENNEYIRACLEEDLVEIADAIGDLLYVVLGAAVQHGIDIQPIFDEIHRSNMTKTPLDPVTGKGGKGPSFEQPRIAELLLMQSTGLNDPMYR